MFKSPARSKRRLRERLGPRATQIAADLCECALEDLRDWPGTACYAPAAAADSDWLAGRGRHDAIVIEQRPGNLGERIGDVGRRLLAAGYERQLFIGIDCPEIDSAYLTSAARALERGDVVLGPSSDGGVVLMGTRGAWPAIADLRWSTAHLMADLENRCRSQGRSIEWLATLRDVDSAVDLAGLERSLAGDDRPARRKLRSTLSGLAEAIGT